MAMDISAVGAKIVFKVGSGMLAGTQFIVSEFSDEGTPFDAPDVDLSDNKKNLNGEMISSRTPSVIPFSVTVMPGSVSDIILRGIAAESLIMPGNAKATTAVYFSSVEVTFPAVFDYSASGEYTGGETARYNGVTYTNVRMKSAPTGPSTSAEGRMSARTYSFEAEGMNVEYAMKLQ